VLAAMSRAMAIGISGSWMKSSTTWWPKASRRGSAFVYDIDGSRWTQNGDTAEFHRLPISDAPMVLAERQAILLEETTAVGE